MKETAAVPAASAPGFERIEVAERKVECDGGGGPLGHPLVYLTIKEGEDEVVCPYCSRTFVLAGHGH